VATETGRHEEAIICYKEALQANPADDAVRTRLGAAYMAVGRYGDAAACLTMLATEKENI
jgi:predicted Zn-dependent protease